MVYVCPEARGLAVPAALIAEICKQVRDAGGEFVKGATETAANAKLYESVAVGWPSRHVNPGGEAFHALADLAGLPPRDIVRGLADSGLNRQSPRAR